jgi:N-acetylglucosamine-6-phosphate deacetylase
MNSGEVCARHYSSGQPIRLRWDKGLISSIEPAATSTEADLWIAPALVDLQINGFAGVDFQRDTLSLADLLVAQAGLAAAGCGQFLVTLMTDRWEVMLTRLERLRTLRAAAPELKAAIVGWHIEGPFLSAEPGYCGAHDPDRMLDPTAAHLRQLREMSGRDPVLLTLAPERTGAIDAVTLAVSLGMKVSLGHTNASAEVLGRALTAGATGFTHLGNACPQQLDRHDNILWRVLDLPGLTVSLIADGHHVAPALFRLVHRLLPESAIYYTTDAVAPAGAPPGSYCIGKLQVEVGPDQIVRQPGRSNFAGSGLRPIDGVFRASKMLNRPWQTVWDSLSVRPAQFMGLAHGLAVGQPANLCLIELEAQGRLGRVRTFIQGAERTQNASD